MLRYIQPDQLIMADSSVSSFSSTSLSEDDRRSIISRKRKRKRRHSNDKKRHSNTNNTSLTPSIAAPSDWEQLRAHFQFVLPSDDNDDTNNQKYGSNWQERMVKHYHTHLFKEYVLADLSRVVDIGKIGLRWRTEKEVADGKGFRCCGNLMCNQCSSSSSNNTAAAVNNNDTQDQEAYASAVKRHMGIAVPENGGKVPLGVLLPTESTTSDALEVYLQSCADEQQQMINQIKPEHKKKRTKHSYDHKSKKHKRKRHHQSYSLEKQEKNEVARLESLPYGMGLHDYEVDFVYVEQQVKKRELVKVRLCLRCAPLLFIAKLNDSKGSSSDRKAPAVKAREARELAARNHASNTSDASIHNTTQSIDSSIT